MPDYKKMYFTLFNAVTAAVSELQKAQQDGEDAYVEGGGVPKPRGAEEKPEADS